MASLTRLLHPLPAAGCRRPYSSFFSRSGGRYFNSAKAPKPVVAATGTGASTNKNKVERASVSLPDVSDSNLIVNGHSTLEQPTPPLPLSHIPHASSLHPVPQQPAQAMSHPMISSKDLKLHQFFALHRPLLLISNPSLILETAPQRGPLYPEAEPEEKAEPQMPYESHASMEADAEAARQITRALTMHSTAGTLAWNATLQRLGADSGQDIEQVVSTAAQMQKAWNSISMDSTKRKRRKKMKKHKLKKRRRLTRQQVKK